MPGNKALAAVKANAKSAPAVELNSGVGTEVLNYSNSPMLHFDKRKAEEPSSSDCPSEPAKRRPAPGIRSLKVSRPRAPWAV